VSRFSIAGTFKNYVMLVTQEADCDRDSESSLFYLRAGTAIETRRCCQKYASQCVTYLFLVHDQRDAQIPFYVFIFNSLHVSSTSCSSSGETHCVNTTSGSCHSVLVAVSCACWQ
jgi:hypothetical protein